MNWDNIRFFIAVARAGSVAGAARAMSVKHTTILRRIDQLESDMDIKLFNRLNSGYSLTLSGQRIFNEAQIMESNVIKMGRDLRCLDKSLSGIINFTLPVDLRDLVIPMLATFSDQYPDIRLNIMVATEKMDLNSLECDVALRVSHNIDEHLIGRQVGYMHFAAFVAQSIYTTDKRSMADYPWIAWSLDQNDKKLEYWISERFGADRLRLCVNDVHAVKQLIVKGYAASFLPIYMIKPEDKLHQFSDSDKEYSTPIWLLTHSDYRGIPRIKALMDFLAEALSHI